MARHMASNSARDAFEHMRRATHVGKIVIDVQGKGEST